MKIVLAGDLRDRKHYESLIAKHGVRERVCLKGFIAEEEIVELYANALGVCYLPFDEDYGYVTLEGMLAAKPVIVPNDGGGATEFIEHEQDGLIVNPEPRAIADALDRLHADRARAHRMGERGQEKLLSMKLSWKNVVEKIVSAAE